MIETIVAAAIRSKKSGIIYSLPPPNRHPNIIWTMPFVGNGPERENGFQGFVTSTGRFVGRKKARKIALKANQIIRRCGGDDEELFSENLW